MSKRKKTEEAKEDSIVIQSSIQEFLAFDALCQLFGFIKRHYFVDFHVKKMDFNVLSTEYIQKYGIHRRFFYAATVEVDRIVKAYYSNLKNSIISTKEKFKKTESYIKRCKDKEKLHRNKRKLHRLTCKLEKFTEKFNDPVPRICFGTKALFKKQHNLEANGFVGQEDWLRIWQATRNNQYVSIGSHDQTACNSLCQINPDLTEMKLRMPYCLEEQYGKHVKIPLEFNYGVEHLENARNNKKTISVRLIKKFLKYRSKTDTSKLGSHVYAHVSVERIEIPYITNLLYGVIGIDTGPYGIDGYELEEYGNPLGKPLYWSWDLIGKRSDQIEDILGCSIAELVVLAVQTGKPIAVETLDFWLKKQVLAELFNPKYARMLSTFPYTKFLEMLKSRAQKFGVQVIEVEPDYTSIIGVANWSEKLGINRDSSAGITIGRRALGFSERFSGQVTSDVPARKRREHVWKYWKRYQKNLVAKKKKAAKLAEKQAKQLGKSKQKRKGQSSEDALGLGLAKTKPGRKRPLNERPSSRASSLSDMLLSSSQVIPASASISGELDKGRGKLSIKNQEFTGRKAGSGLIENQDLSTAQGSAAGIRAAGWEGRSPNKSTVRGSRKRAQNRVDGIDHT